MRVFHFLNAEFGLKDIRERRLKISRLNELNDPFEFLGVDLADRSSREGLIRTKLRISQKNGLICFSSKWSNPVLWGHYADRHRGLCLAFDVPDDSVKKVDYVDSRFSWPTALDESFAEKLLFTKFSHWSYEDEYRAYMSLDVDDVDIYYADFSEQLVLKQVIVGANSAISRLEISTALRDLNGRVEVFKARAAFRKFEVIRNKNHRLWT
jgi:hypothetical protein